MTIIATQSLFCTHFGINIHEGVLDRKAILLGNKNLQHSAVRHPVTLEISYQSVQILFIIQNYSYAETWLAQSPSTFFENISTVVKKQNVGATLQTTQWATCLQWVCCCLVGIAEFVRLTFFLWRKKNKMVYKYHCYIKCYKFPEA